MVAPGLCCPWNQFYSLKNNTLFLDLIPMQSGNESKLKAIQFGAQMHITCRCLPSKSKSNFNHFRVH